MWLRCKFLSMWARCKFLSMWSRRKPPSVSRPHLRAGLLTLALLTGTPSPATALDIHEQILTRAEWPQHTNGDNVAALPAVQLALTHFKENNRTTLIIRHPGGDPGQHWAHELHNWLVSFGVPTNHLKLQPGSGAADRLVVNVVERD